MALASAYGTIQEFLEQDVLSNVAQLLHDRVQLLVQVRTQEKVVEECMAELAHKHPCIKQGRTVTMAQPYSGGRDTVV